MEDTLVAFGSEIKTVEETADAYKFGGYLVVFDSPDQSSLRDRFTKSTDFDFEDGDSKSIYYNHGLDGTFQKTRIGKGRLFIKDAGVWMEGEIQKRKDYLEKHIERVAEGMKMTVAAKGIEAPLFGLSSGALSHLVEREPVGDGHVVKTWNLGEASITPTPAEPMAACVSLKSLMEIEKAEEIKYDPRQPRDDHGKWTDSAGNLSAGHAAHVMRAEGISDEHAKVVLEKIKDGTHKTREDVLGHIDAIHAANGTTPLTSASKTPAFPASFGEHHNHSGKINVINGQIASNIRGGGTGNYGAWVAKITGTGGQYGLEREFVKKDTSGVSGSGRSGYIGFHVDEPGVYEYRKLGSDQVNSKTEVSGFLHVQPDGHIHDISKDEAIALHSKYPKSRKDAGESDQPEEPEIKNIPNFTSSDEVVTATSDLLRTRMPLPWHAEAVRTAVDGFSARLGEHPEVKAGRQISAENHAYIKQTCEALKVAYERLQAMVDAHEPSSDDDTKSLTLPPEVQAAILQEAEMVLAETAI